MTIDYLISAGLTREEAEIFLLAWGPDDNEQ